MATNKAWAFSLLLVSGAAWSREAASVPACQSAAAKPAIASAKAAVERAPGDLTANFGLADAWSDAGCFSDAVQVLQAAQVAHPGNKELETRLRVAHSLVGEEHYFDTLDRADAEAKLKRDTFRCNTLSDLEACKEAARLRPTPELTAKLNAAEAQGSGRSASAAAEENASGGRTAGSPPLAETARAKPQKSIRVARTEATRPTPEPSVANATSGRRFSNVPVDERSH